MAGIPPNRRLSRASAARRAASAACPVLTAALLSFAAAACGHDSLPAQPTPADVTPAPVNTINLGGRIVGSLDDAGLPGVSVRVASGFQGTSEADGRFLISSVPAGRQAAVVSAASIVTRETAMTAPGGGITMPVIPADFDLASFNQMLRSSGRIQRWARAPSLVVISRVLKFTSYGDNEFVALSAELGAREIDLLVSDLASGFAALTGGQIGGFASVTVERPAPGATVLVKRPGTIVVADHDGLTAATGYWGYGRWATTADDEVVGGIVFLDRSFEASEGIYVQSLRIHELGHALGYNHVTMRVSAMNSSARNLPNDWDRQAIRIAFQRPPGNRSPDTDPAAYSANVRYEGGRGPVTWSDWIH